MKLIASAAEMRAIPRSAEFRNGGVSFWYRETGLPERRPALPGSADYDVCIVGGGYTGLWTAYYLKKARPELRVAILEREFAGFGASGRNGGWLSAEFAGSRERYAQTHGKGAMIALQRAMMAAVDEVIAVAEAEGIDADIVKDGMRLVATNQAQRERLEEEVRHLQEWGYWPEDIYLLEDDREPALRVADTVAAAYSPHAARIQPAKLVLGLASVVEGLGVDIFEDTPVTEIRPREEGRPAAAVTETGEEVRAEYVIRATEGFTASLSGQRRQWLPMNSSMIATEPIGADIWERIGWERRELLGDSAHTYIYAQRTADDRIAIGGRGIPYRFGSGHDSNGATPPQTIAELWRALTRLFPEVREVPVAHAWSGVLGVPRDWCPTVSLNREEGLGWAGGYVGSGVTTSNLAGRTLCDLVLGRDGELARLPWVGRRVRGWEPEPLRWVGTQVIYGLYRSADRREADRGSRTSRLAGIAGRIAGR
ncbi:NAD(P)/FAD-dependent oxidoreductase [Marinactinospora thermotolerans]|uniref:Glycine/D-amino acid oxidase n=1 Tax=Marinactinospora thermotolerans DSM 45154 TaxID=1122192 RepID=A0A1T4SKX5_9ACTN|nr:FAD-binding oxidoreductase [Marinactinospora thermotolerans]SKA28521.1 Glycine/D-amino acid oxidase [Marinactinospora thermotolerans DSM 45154]